MSMKKPFLNLVPLLSPIFCLSLLGAAGGDAATTVFSVPEDYATIQAAIDAAGIVDDTIIQIAPGDYYEQLLISNKKLTVTLSGQPGTILHAREDLEQTLRPRTKIRAVVGIAQSASVVLVGLTIDGNQRGGAYFDGGLQGVFCLGSDVWIEDCILRGFRGDSLETYSFARALALWNPESAGTSGIEVKIISNRFENNETSIAIAGDDEFNPSRLRTTFTVQGNTITGFGPAALAIDGVVVYTGAAGIFSENIITDHQYTGTGDPYSSGISASDGFAISRNPAQFVPLQPIRFERNIFRNNNDHLVLVNAPRSEVVNNIFDGTGLNGPRWGAIALSGGNIQVANNDFSDGPTGIFLFGNDRFFDAWPLLGVATDAILSGNWFSNVTERVRAPAPVTGLQEQGTVVAPFRSTFQSATRDAAGFHATIRNWHAPVVIESSADFQTWTPVHTNEMALPVLSFSDAAAPGLPRQFYRARTK
jgi:hypothetical protein